MATYYKYAERSADSQVNWAEIGKNMSDMLKEEVNIREEKKAAINEASRKYGEVLANSPQGEHEPARTAALKFADSASKYSKMQDQLLKSGQLSLRDYTIGRQNLLDGTDNAFTALKDFQAVFSKKMERARTDKSSLFEIRSMEQAESFGNWRKSGFYINPTDGSVSVAKMTPKTIDGKEVYTMDDKPGEFASVNYVKGLIQGEWDKYDTNAVTTAFSEGLGEEMKSIQGDIATYSKTGSMKSISDITSRTDIDPDTKEIMYRFIDSENQMINAALTNDFNRASVLTDNNIIASNGKAYDFTSDEKLSKANPNLILQLIDPDTGQSKLEFSPEQIKESQEFMRTQARAKYKYTEETRITPQLERNEPRAKTPGEEDRIRELEESRNFAKQMALAVTGTPEQIANAVKYLSQKTGKIVDRTNTGLTISNADGTGKSTYGFSKDGKISTAKDIGSSSIGGFSTAAKLREADVLKEYNKFIGGKPIETKTSASGFETPTPKKKVIDVFNTKVQSDFSNPELVNSISTIQDDGDIRDELNRTIGVQYGLEFDNAYSANEVFIPANQGRPKSPYFPVGTPAKNKKALSNIQAWIQKNYLKGETLEEKEAEAELIISQSGGSGAVGTVTGGKER